MRYYYELISQKNEKKQAQISKLKANVKNEIKDLSGIMEKNEQKPGKRKIWSIKFERSKLTKSEIK